MEDRIKDLSDLPDFRTMKIEWDGMPKRWGFCRGWKGSEPGQWAIQRVNDDYSVDIYPLPLAVTALVNWERIAERQELQRSFRELLGIDASVKDEMLTT
jgi:hypothetical protein